MPQFHAARPFILAQLRRPAAGTGIRIGNPPRPATPTHGLLDIWQNRRHFYVVHVRKHVHVHAHCIFTIVNCTWSF